MKVVISKLRLILIYKHVHNQFQ